MTQTNNQALKTIYKTSIIVIIGNIILAGLKLFAGIFGFSKALISDAIHSLSDVFSTIIVLVGASISKKEPDKNHFYGHEKFESVASIILSMILIFTALLLGYQAVQQTIAYFNQTLILKPPKAIAFYIAIFSILTKEAMFWYTRHYAKKLSSTSLMADAWHHRSDALSSIGSMVGIGFAMMGFLYFDAIASFIISLIVFKVGIDILKTAVNQVVDAAPDKQTMQEMGQFILKQDGVLGVDLLHARLHVDKLFVDVEIAVKDSLSLIEAHAIAESVHLSIEKAFPTVKHCMVHVNPLRKVGKK